MEKITYALICQEVLGNEENQIIRNPKYLLTPLSIPGNFSFTLAIGVAELLEKIQYKLLVELHSPSKNNILKIIDVNFDTPAKVFATENQIFEGNLSFGFPNFEFFEEGVYKLDIKLSSSGISISKDLEFMIKSKAQMNS